MEEDCGFNVPWYYLYVGVQPSWRGASALCVYHEQSIQYGYRLLDLLSSNTGEALRFLSIASTTAFQDAKALGAHRDLSSGGVLLLVSRPPPP